MTEKRKKFGGRQKGSKNKINSITRQFILETGLIDTDELKRRMKAIKSDAEYCKVVIQLMKFVTPQMKSVEFTGEKQPVNIVLPEMTIEQMREILNDKKQHDEENQ